MKKPLVIIFIIVLIILVASISTLIFLSQYKIVNIEKYEREKSMRWFINEENEGIVAEYCINNTFVNDSSKTALIFPGRKFTISEEWNTARLLIKNPTNKEITVKAKVRTDRMEVIKNNTENLFIFKELKNNEAWCYFQDTHGETSSEYKIQPNEIKTIYMNFQGKNLNKNKINAYQCNVTIEGLEKDNQKQLTFVLANIPNFIY